MLQWLNKGLWWYRISRLLYDYPDRMIPSTWICPLIIRTKVSNIWLWWELLSASYLLCVWSCLCYIRDGISSISQNWKNYTCSCVLVIMLFRFLHSRSYPSQFWLIEPTSSFVCTSSRKHKHSLTTKKWNSRDSLPSIKQSCFIQRNIITISFIHQAPTPL